MAFLAVHNKVWEEREEIKKGLSSFQAEFRGTNKAQNLLDLKIKSIPSLSRSEKLLRVRNGLKVKIKAMTVRLFVKTLEIFEAY